MPEDQRRIDRGRGRRSELLIGEQGAEGNMMADHVLGESDLKGADDGAFGEDMGS